MMLWCKRISLVRFVFIRYIDVIFQKKKIYRCSANGLIDGIQSIKTMHFG
jgi:hypothetical protein